MAENGILLVDINLPLHKLENQAGEIPALGDKKCRNKKAVYTEI